MPEEIRVKLDEANKLIEVGVRKITELQNEIARLEREGRDTAHVRARLAEWHALQLQFLAEQTQLRVQQVRTQ